MKIYCFCLTLFIFYSIQPATAQGCSDAGFCTIGSFHEPDCTVAYKKIHRNEIDVSYTYATHLKNERFQQAQINYRYIRKNGSTYEIRVPFGRATNKLTNPSNSGMGDITGTYNDKFHLGKQTIISYAVGLRISLSGSDKSDPKNNLFSLPMYLQNGLGTTDLLAVLNYNPIKYLSISTGVQVPVVQYNQHRILLTDVNGNMVIGTGFRRKPDGLLKLMGNYSFKKLSMSAGILGIFHLANDYYNTGAGKFVLKESRGTTLNYSFEATYALSQSCRFSVLFAEPFKTRNNIPDGLARSRIINPKLSFSF